MESGSEKAHHSSLFPHHYSSLITHHSPLSTSTHMKIRVAIHGAAGRMGQRLVAIGSADPELAIVAALEAANHPRLGEDADGGRTRSLGVPISSKLEVGTDAIIDFRFRRRLTGLSS